MSDDSLEKVEEYFKQQLALHHLINVDPNRVFMICSQCNQYHSMKDMQIRKAPGKSRFYFGQRCKNCVRGKTVGMKGG